jgi:cyclopropane-fatty-acyl-phospholipid synthase
VAAKGPADVIADAVVSRGLLPDPLLRAAVRASCARRLLRERRRGAGLAAVSELSAGPIAVETAAANEQHYELPPELFGLVLGPRRKYSGCFWPAGVESLAVAEEAMLALTCERAGLEDGMEVLDLGCGWGSLSGWIAERYPGCRVLAVSNSASQRAYVDSLGLAQVEVVTADVGAFQTERRFDRVVSVEMFEHMRNWDALLAKVRGWLRPEGRLFVHVFAHRRHTYLFEESWLARRFFTGGVMPSDELLRRFDRHLTVSEHWRVDGRHYERTANAWLANLDAARGEAEALLGSAAAVNEWRTFLIACAELFGFREGSEWLVSHTLLEPR